MSYEIWLVFALLVVALALFAWERFSFDVTALIILSILLVTGLVTPEEGIAGFSNPAVVTIGAMFVLSEGLRRTGFLDILGEKIVAAGQGSFWRTLLLMMGTLGVVSAFINNTAAVAIFIPVVLGVAAKLGVSPSKLLIPISFASMFGGVCTLIGTSTNLLVSSIAEEHGLGAFDMFQLAPVGLAFFVVGFLYLALVGVKLLPARRSPEDLTRSYGMGGYITDVVVREGSELVGETVDSSALTEGLDVDVLEILRGGDRKRKAGGGEGADGESAAEGESRAWGPRARIEAGDVLRVRGNAESIDELLDAEGLDLEPPLEWVDADLEQGRAELVEAVVAPDSSIVQKPVRHIRFGERFGAVILALRHHGEIERDDLGEIRLSGGDSVLLLMDPERAGDVEDDEAFVLASHLGRRKRRDRMWWAVAILVGVVLTAALDVAPIVLTAVVGALVLVATGCLTTQQAYDAINWKVIFLLAGILPLGTAMEKTGAAGLLADWLLNTLGGFGPHVVLAGILAVTVALTAVVTNNATAVLLAPIAISAGQSLGVDPLPMVMAVTYGASLSFVTPVGYQTNTLVYGPGGYAFTDYTKVGAPLNLLFLALGTVLIPMVFPF